MEPACEQPGKGVLLGGCWNAVGKVYLDFHNSFDKSHVPSHKQIRQMGARQHYYKVYRQLA